MSYTTNTCHFRSETTPMYPRVSGANGGDGMRDNCWRLEARPSGKRITGLAIKAVLAGVVTLVAASRARADSLPDWTTQIRGDHPRLFFNADTWPAVRDRALDEEKAWYESVQSRVDRLASELEGVEKPEARDLGPEAARSAFVFLMTEEPKYLDLAKKCLDTSLRYYDECFEQKKSVNWYSTSRVHAVMAWDWLYNHMTEAERRDTMSRLVTAIDRVLKARPPIHRENMSGYDTGFYGVKNCLWFIGCTAFGTGIETERVNEWLVWGHDENLKMLRHREKACGEAGGGASPTLGYVFGAYPWAEQNYFYTWLSSTGENIAPQWPHSAWLARYVIWNWIEADPVPLEFGYGDTPHTTNRLPTGQLYTHMAHIRHLHGQSLPEAAALARHVQEKLPKQSYSRSWFIYPFLLTNLENSPPAASPDDLPSAFHFESMGQVFMRSGMGPDDTYCLFTCGGILRQHRHYDALNFVIYHRGHLALDSGTRYREFDNGEHLANYFAQTVAHNCVLVHQPGEPPAPYWGGTVEGNHGGQHKQLGSMLKAFEVHDDHVYVAGDATPCYQHGVVQRDNKPNLPEKCLLVTRQLVFLKPDRFIVFDRVTTTDPEYDKDWLLHTAHEPVVDGDTFRADHREGRLFCRTLLPERASIRTVGGPGKRFWAAGKNWTIVDKGLTPKNKAMMGQWRIEVSPPTAQREDCFLHVIQVGSQERKDMGDVELVKEAGRRGVRLLHGERPLRITFDTTGDLNMEFERGEH
ncbi:MAG: heparinase II/III domain-containing protein [Planctomycetota bacterium]